MMKAYWIPKSKSRFLTIATVMSFYDKAAKHHFDLTKELVYFEN